jgi:hypothetical protein
MSPDNGTPNPAADSGAVELMCSLCGFKGTPIIVAVHDCVLDGDEQALTALERAENDSSDESGQ